MTESSSLENRAESLIARDYLAIDRTFLANERTLLAYVRTAMALLVLGITLLHFLESLWSAVLAWVSIFFGVVLLGVGAWRFLRLQRRLVRLYCGESAAQGGRAATNASYRSN